MVQQILFLFVGPGVDPQTSQARFGFTGAELHVAGAPDLEAAVETARAYAGRGVKFIELCAGFGHRGVARIAEAVGPGVSVGVVRFDAHPAFGGQSGC